MKSYYRDPQVEEGVHNIILQNRCGNRLSLLIHDKSTEMEFVYKPNAFRRKEWRARNFSDRDNFTTLFAESLIPEIGAAMVKKFDYDPFITGIETLSDAKAYNLLKFVNVADENCFAIAARCPLLLSFRPRVKFDLTNGLIHESFEDRGESIVSFIKFDSFEENRFRVLDDGSHVLQLFENEVILIGGEENAYQVDRVVRALGGLDLKSLIERNERLLEPVLAKGKIHFADADYQKVIDINRRLVYSGLDEGGACFGALNRIYHLIWVRDGAMAATQYALAGNPTFAQIYAPFVLGNPAQIRKDNGERVREYLQRLGTRWTKSEDDGLFYVTHTLFTLLQTTGDDSLLTEARLAPLVQIADHVLATRFNQELELFGSDTRGESTLAGSIYYGYDTVNGQMDPVRLGADQGGRVLKWYFGLYHNTNTYNVLRMLQTLLGSTPNLRSQVGGRFVDMAQRLRQSLNRQFINEKGIYRGDLLIFADGGRQWVEFDQADYWEYAWGVSLGPFFPNPAVALRSCRAFAEAWPKIRMYGYCPWNNMARMMRDFGMSTAQFKQMLADEIREALLAPPKYPMAGLAPEYFSWTDGWRGLPFSAATLTHATASLLLQSLPMGICVRASDLVDSIDNFHWRTARLSATASGSGDAVKSVLLNGKPLVATLQIPEARLRLGFNRIEVTRGGTFAGFRLHGSDAALIDIESADRRIVYHMTSPVESQLIFEGYAAAANIAAMDHAGKTIATRVEAIPETDKTLLIVESRGDFDVVAQLK